MPGDKLPQRLHSDAGHAGLFPDNTKHWGSCLAIQYVAINTLGFRMATLLVDLPTTDEFLFERIHAMNCTGYNVGIRFTTLTSEL